MQNTTHQQIDAIASSNHGGLINEHKDLEGNSLVSLFFAVCRQFLRIYRINHNKYGALRGGQ
ncbi:hypothetical protein DN92_08790 [Polynucleobacter arcticus]|uniref:Uncharacterized protein n=1 Tax=Polynucleobacter arcticus TaxID=1743165 RepID=A0A6M9PQL2_9BURK|nr:hypothetical protein DN92_08790 [Polynucleobacter arcticus]